MNWYVSRERVKAALGGTGAVRDKLIDAQIEAASRRIDNRLTRRLGVGFIPRLGTFYFDWPQDLTDRGWELRIPPFLSITELRKNGGDDVIASSDYILEPVNEGPPFTVIEILRSSSAFFEAEGTPQRAIEVDGIAGYGTEEAAGALAAAVSDTTGTAVTVTDGSLVDVGHTLLVGDEQMFVSERAPNDTGATLAADLNGNKGTVTMTLSDGALVKQGEVIQIDGEKFLVKSITGNVVTVEERAYDGTVGAAHSSGATVYAFRTLTVVRGVNGTTAATHTSGLALARYAPPADIAALCLSEAIFNYEQDKSGQSGFIGVGDATQRVTSVALNRMWMDAEKTYLGYGGFVFA